MRHATSLLPFALASAAVVVASAVAVLGSVRPQSAGVTPPAESTAGPRAAGQQATLSGVGRLAYWRADVGGSLQLWVSDIDGGRRRAIATAASGADISFTRWAPDGSAIAYVSGGASVALVRLDGPTGGLALPVTLLRGGWRIVAIEWAPDAQNIAVTLRAGQGTSNESDVYVAPTLSGARFERVTSLGDAYAGRWIDEERLFIETAHGVTAVLDLRTRVLRPLSALPLTSPMVGGDGRVYAVGGEVLPDVVTGPVAVGSVWSMTIDGDDLRRESAAGRGQVRLYGMLGDGRALVGVPGAMFAAGDSVVPFLFEAGTPRRLIVAPDGRRAYGVTESQVLVVDAARIPRTAQGRAPVTVPAAVLLSDARSADVWFAPPDAALARGRAPAAGARYAFALGNAVWEQDAEGRIRDLVTGGRPGELRWSRSGERLAFTRALGAPQPAMATVVGPGTVREWELPTVVALPLEWAPDGRSVAVSIASGARRDVFTTYIYDVDTGREIERVQGRLHWAGEARVVLTDGERRTDGGENSPRAGQRVEAERSGSRAVVVDAARFGTVQALRDVFSGEGTPVIERMLPSPDGARLALITRGSTGLPRDHRILVVRVSDGEVIAAPRIDPTSGGATLGGADLAWSPDGTRVAWTAVAEAGTTAAQSFVPRPAVLDVRAPASVASPDLAMLAEGRFAGWAPDGRVYFYARPEDGLFVQDLATGATQSAGPIAARVVASAR